MMKPKTTPERATRTTLDTICFTPQQAEKWKIPPFQRERRDNERVRQLQAAIRSDDGVIPGIITLGRVKSNDETYLVDGQHRIYAFIGSGCAEGYADVRTCFADSMAELGEEFVKLNSSLVRMRPDDVLRGMEFSLPSLAALRQSCPFLGFDNIRRSSEKSPVLSVSVALRVWSMSRPDIPAGSTDSALELAKAMTAEEQADLAKFLRLCYQAWGRDVAYSRMWGGLNLTMCAWLFRRCVNREYSPRSIRMTEQDFQRGLMALSADANYTDWLVGRAIGERDRAPAYTRITAIMSRRWCDDQNGPKPNFPRPAWALGAKGR